MPENEISINREQFTTEFSLNLKVFDRVQKIIEVKLDEWWPSLVTAADLNPWNNWSADR